MKLNAIRPLIGGQIVRNNLYSAGAAEVISLFSDHIDKPEDDCIALALGERSIGKAPRRAIDQSLEAFGYGRACCCYAALIADPATASENTGELDPQALHLLIEALDPLFIICADEKAAHTLGKAYRCSLNADALTRVQGRPLVAFRMLEDMLDSEKGRQKAWRLLKGLPRRAGS